MKRIKYIGIPKPCNESWESMTAAEKGRHCQSCCKTVVDFSAMDNADIIAYLATHKNTCGRITGNKLAAVNHRLEMENRKRFSWKALIAAASLSMLFPAVNAKSQNRPKTEQAPLVLDSLSTVQIAAADTSTYITIEGVVKAKDDGLPIPGVTVKVKDDGINIGTQTALNGSFTLRVPAFTKRITFSFVGYQIKEIKLRHINAGQTVVLSPVLESAVSGLFEVVNVGY